MSCPHSLKGSQDDCSQCRSSEVTVRRVVLTDGATLVDGIPQPTVKPTGWMGKRKRGAE